ncbi:Osmotin thaumatin-like protein [Fomes fomentarius]|nr:Osmotin thaumatin-like protein [Fomes fomentarius]
MRGLAFTISLAFAATAAARTFTVYNQCPFTIWPAIFTGAGNGSSQPNGWEQEAYQAVSFFVPDNWQAGRIWARRNCDFSKGATGPNTCADGGCNGGLVCTGTGVPPATLAEFTLGANGADNYDVSLVDGYNLPMRITNSKGCPIADCPVDLGPNCPDQLKGPLDASGFPLGCKSACLAGIGDSANNPNCCTGSFASPGACQASGVAFYAYFKANCPNAYAFAFDEASGTALHSCSASTDYTVTFCP